MNEPLAICTVVTIAVTGVVSCLGFKNPRLVEYYLFSTEDVLVRRQYHRLFTAGLLHADWPHLLFNMFSLYSFARYVELLFGPLTFLLIYLASILGGNLLALAVHRRHEYRSIGASGGVCGIIFASIFLLPGQGVMIFPIPVLIPSWLYALLFIVASYVGMRKAVGNIGHDAHLGGAIIGLLVATALHPQIVLHIPLLYSAVLVLSGLLLACTYEWPFDLTDPSLFTRERWHQAQQDRRERAEARQAADDERKLERLLDKISRSGMQSLSEAEQRELTAISERRSHPHR